MVELWARLFLYLLAKDVRLTLWLNGLIRILVG
jgi:hypothetical protein